MQFNEMILLKSFHYGKHRRTYRPGDKVLIENGRLINSQGIKPTHEIRLLHGMLGDSKHVITLLNLSTNEPLKIEL